jgi:2-C-methyl-D-erythritol 4-phosphate cytidylyltransferase/2-C-methyl-D-erythritol 2,4-cyclodiphosphate synthase
VSDDSGDRCVGLILAGGSGKRMGMNRPKAFVPLAGRALVAWSLIAFARHPDVTDVLVVVPPGWEDRFREAALSAIPRELQPALKKIWGVVPGGAHRQDSTRLGLEAACGILPACAAALVLVHDAARPSVSPELITRVVTRLRAGGESGETPRPGVIPVVAEPDTLKEIAETGTDSVGRVRRTVPRAGLWRAQTPQGFELHALLEAHEAARTEGRTATDDAMLFEWRGWPVDAVPGEASNVKITEREDLARVEAYLAQGLRADGEP